MVGVLFVFAYSCNKDQSGMKTDIKTLIDALRIIEVCAKDCGFAATLAEAADRLEKLQRKVRNQRRELEQLKGKI